MTGDSSLSVEARLALSLALTKLPDPQFNLLVFSLNPPPGILPSNLAAQGDRVVVLLQWVENNGPGLAVLQQALAQITGQAIAPPGKAPTPEPTTTGKIFISYRRDDSASDTGRIYDRLAQEFGRDNIFKDVDSIPFGVDFAQHIDQEVGRCQVLLVVMGKNWVTPRLQNPDDFVRLEIESALGRGIPVVPVFLEGVTAPPPRDRLPESLHPLIRRNGTQVGHDPRFHADMGRLVKGLRDYFQQPSRPVQPSPPPVIPSQTVLGGSASQVNEPTGPVFTGPMTGNTININSSDTTAPAPVQPQDSSEPDPSYPCFGFEVVTVDSQGQIIERRKASAPYQTVDLGKGVTLDMVLIPGGSFMMGSLD
ncbi:MAG: TIR domain-containing protein, partial [Nodosilinea sp.]